MRENILARLYPIIYRALYTALLTGVLICGAGRTFGVTQAGGIHWGMATVVLLLLAGINYGEINIKIISTSVLILCVLVAIPLIGAGEITDFFRNYFYWLFGWEGYNGEWLPGYQFMQIAWIVAVCYAFEVLTEKRRILRDILAVLLLAGLIVSMLMELKTEHSGVALTICYIVISFIERTRMGWTKKKERNHREYTLWLLPFVGIYMILLLSSPVEEEPYDWEWARKIYVNVSEKVTIWIEDMMRNGAEDFGVAMAGFSEESSLRSGVMESDKEFLTIQGGKGWPVNVYLIGKTYDSFNGKEWEHTIEDTLQELPFDMLETEYAVRRYDESGMENYIYKAKLSVRYEHFNTGYLFAPMKVTKIENMEYQVDGRDLVFGEQRGYSTEYSLLYYQLNMTNSAFYEMMETDLPEDEQIWNKVLKMHHIAEKEHYDMQALQEYREAIRENYYQEVTLSEEVQEYVDRITKGCETDIDKLQAIEKELSGYVYTTTPGKLPWWIKNQEDFLDYFLLESKTGYCSYFATAFVLLARAEGLPARYVEGFCIPIAKEKVMTATADMVHAWPEVYIEGVGWIPFEPTPGYGEIRQTGWKVKEESDPNEAVGEQDAASDKWEQWRPTVEEEIPEEVLADRTEAEVQEEDNRQRMIAIAVLTVCLVGILALWVESLLMRRRYQRMNTEQRFLVEVKRILGIYARLGCKRAENETLSELQERLQENFAEELQEGGRFDFLQYYQEYLYRGDKVSEEILTETIAERTELLNWIKQERKWYYYVLLIRLKTGFL